MGRENVMEVKFYDTVDDSLLKFVVIISQRRVRIRSSIGMLVHLYLQEMKHKFLYLVSSM